jgi:Flp pilus assembly protein TadD
VLERDPDHLDALLSLAQLCRVSSNTVEAVELLNHAHRTHPNDPDVSAAVAQLASELGDHAGARQALDTLRQLAPDHPALRPA